MHTAEIGVIRKAQPLKIANIPVQSRDTSHRTTRLSPKNLNYDDNMRDEGLRASYVEWLQGLVVSQFTFLIHCSLGIQIRDTR